MYFNSEIQLGLIQVYFNLIQKLNYIENIDVHRILGYSFGWSAPTVHSLLNILMPGLLLLLLLLLSVTGHVARLRRQLWHAMESRRRWSVKWISTYIHSHTCVYSVTQLRICTHTLCMCVCNGRVPAAAKPTI